jgi:hypothetical protein
MKMASLWRDKQTDILTFTLPEESQFGDYFDSLQKKNEKITVTTFWYNLVLHLFLTGLSSKSKSQVLRVAALFHILFFDDLDDVMPPVVISSQSLSAAIDYVKTCCKHASFIAGRSKNDDEIEKIESCKCLWLLIGTNTNEILYNFT